MILSRVTGTVTSTQKNTHLGRNKLLICQPVQLDGAKIQMVQPLSLELEPIGKPIAAIDTVGAGEGELVYYVTAYEAVIPFFRPMVPIDASLVGIIDSIDFHEKKTAPAKKTGKTKKVTK